MKKLCLISAMSLSMLTAHAQDLWVVAPDKWAANQILNAEIAYGDRFPEQDPIAPAQAKRLKPLELIDGTGKRTPLHLIAGNDRYASAQALKAGTYHLLASSQTGNCQQTQMFSKRLLVVDNQYDEITATIPVGQLLEIVPLDSPADVRAGSLLPLQVWYQGKPLANATITATADTYLDKDPNSTQPHRQIQAYSAQTDADGRVNFIPLIGGIWKIKVSHQASKTSKNTCPAKLEATYLMTVEHGQQSAPRDYHPERPDHH